VTDLERKDLPISNSKASIPIGPMKNKWSDEEQMEKKFEKGYNDNYGYNYYDYVC
jgi:hypothetical protein